MITDEMVWMATLRYIDSLQNAEFWRLDLSKPEAMRAALEAVLPMIRAEVLEEAAKVADKCGTFESGDISYSIRAMKGDKP
jgi:hypothetical protein